MVKVSYSRPPQMPTPSSCNAYHGKTDFMMRHLVMASAVFDVSHMIQRRPSFSAAYAVVPEPPVMSMTRSPGSEHMAMHRSMTASLVWTVYILPPLPRFIFSQTLVTKAG